MGFAVIMLFAGDGKLGLTPIPFWDKIDYPIC
jgi:hypothetical protein